MQPGRPQDSSPADLRPGRGGNRLGTYIRAQRLAEGLRLIDLAQATGVSAGYLSKIEQGQVVDGPSLAALSRFASALKTDVAHLTRLKELDRADGTVQPGVAGTTENLSEQERLHIANLRRTSGRVQQYVMAQAELANALLGEMKPMPDVRLRLAQLAASESDSSTFAKQMTQIADAFIDFGFRVMDFDHVSEVSEGAFQDAELLYRACGNRLGEAYAHFHLARVWELRAGNLPEDVSYHLQKAVSFFRLAQREYERGFPLDDHHDRYWERYPEAIAKEAEMLVRKAEIDASPALSGTPAEEVPLGVAGPFTQGVVPIAQALREAGQLRGSAVAQYRAWIARLLGRPRQDRKEADYLETLAEAHHRLAIVLRDMAFAAEREAEAGLTTSEQARTGLRERGVESEAELRACVPVRLQLARRLPRHSYEYWRAVNRASNTHQEWGYTIHATSRLRTDLRTESESCERLDVYRRALYQFRIAQRLNKMYPADFDPRQIQYLEDLISVLEQDDDFGAQIRATIDREIRDVLDGANVGRLDYPIELPAKEPS